jgi:hypothetical protein
MDEIWDGVCICFKRDMSEETIEEILDMIDKRIPAKVDKNGYGVYFCPACKESVWQNKEESKYCFRCGKKLSWI